MKENQNFFPNFEDEEPNVQQDNDILINSPEKIKKPDASAESITLWVQEFFNLSENSNIPESERQIIFESVPKNGLNKGKGMGALTRWLGTGHNVCQKLYTLATNRNGDSNYIHRLARFIKNKILSNA